MKKTLITADSTCLIPSELISGEVPVIQAEVKTKSGCFRESYEITSENILEYAKRERKAPELICPSVEDYGIFFERQLKKASCVCHLCCCANIRSSYASAKKASEKFENVYVADSRQIGGGMLFQVAQAVRLASEGFSPEFIIKSIGELDKHINSTYASKNAFWLGHLNLISKSFSSVLDLLDISPTITVRNGTSISGAVFKNGRDYSERYIRKMLKGKKNIDGSTLIISCPKPFGRDMEKYGREVKKYADFKKIVFTDIPTRFACRLGDDSLGLHFLNV
ncbi:MAG: DegV family protein [Bacteroides sp.]|nr:DegV family protein [Bacteroides sp.]